MSHSNIEIFSLELNSWIQLRLNQFGNLITPYLNSYGEDQEFGLDSMGLKYKLPTKTEKLSMDQITEGDYFEIKKQLNLSVKFSNWYNGGLKLDVLSTDIANYIEEWQGMNCNKKISSNFTVFTRCKVIFKNEETNEVIVSQEDENSYDSDNSTEKVSIDNVRLLSDGVEESDRSTFADNINNMKFFDSNNFLKIKKVSAEDLIRKFKILKDDFVDNIDKAILDSIDLMKFFSESKIDPENENVFCDYSDDKRNEIILISTDLYLKFITHMLSIKLKRFIESEKILKEIQREKEKIESLNKIIETRFKKKFIFSLKFLDSIKSNILDKLNKEDFSYLLNKSDDYFELIIYEKGKKGSLKKIEKEFDLKEDFIRVDLKMADWIKSNESKEELDRIVKTSRIVKIIKIFFKCVD
jgi:hypothetical protein